MTSPDLSRWSGCPTPEPVVLRGRYARLEPLAPHHAPALFDTVRGHPELFAHLHEHPPADEAQVLTWIDAVRARGDLLMWSVIDEATGLAGGRQALMRIDAGSGVVEIGSILWGPRVARTRVATEAFSLHAGYVFDQLGYRRLEWKCDSTNRASQRAAQRLGFTAEGAFAQHMVVKGRNRDTTWFSMVDHQWPAHRTRLQSWLDPANFDADGHQLTPLAGR
jgi:RimJ/RimL family protein N-acetyltransferase